VTTVSAGSTENDIDAGADGTIAQCLSLDAPRSFFLFAGAGSGKTRSLVTALKHIQRDSRAQMRLRGQRVGVITFTNAACDEITQRIEFDPTIDVSTIHSFAWSLIGGLNSDIRKWLRVVLAADIDELVSVEARGRKGTKASATRQLQIASKTKRLQGLDTIKRFVYSPTSDNRGRDSLTHSEVIKLASHFLLSKPVMQSILVNRYPILLIDETQDTNKDLIDAFFVVQGAHKDHFALGLLGDMMQRIYSDGKEGLGQGLPPDWATPAKLVNHRCPKRIVALINNIRNPVDHQQQQARVDSIEGHVRLFILPTDLPDKPAAEQAIALRMAAIASDDKWADPKGYKSLTLVHRMAARRMGFSDVFVPLYPIQSFSTGLLDGTLPAVRFFSDEILPLFTAHRSGNRFAVARIARQSSPLLSADVLRASNDQQAQLRSATEAIDDLMALWRAGADPSLLSILRTVAQTNLFAIPEILQPHISQETTAEDRTSGEDTEDVDLPSERDAAVESFLNAPFSQIEPYKTYVTGAAHFDTHQGVKGREFERVMVIMDDSEARGFMFKYENLFSGSAEGTPSTASTRRLFYVTCSRAMKSLALVAYSTSPERVRRHVLSESWFLEAEVHVGALE
jgi:DNA helicase-2/ATP-dependent DNA helicase PcrA